MIASNNKQTVLVLTSYGLALNATLQTENLNYRYRSPVREDGVRLKSGHVLEIVRHDSKTDLKPKLVRLANGDVGVRTIPKPKKANRKVPKLDLGSAVEQANKKITQQNNSKPKRKKYR